MASDLKALEERIHDLVKGALVAASEHHSDWRTRPDALADEIIRWVADAVEDATSAALAGAEQATTDARRELAEARETIAAADAYIKGRNELGDQTHAAVLRVNADLVAVRNMLADCVVKATEYGTQDGDFVAMYLLPTGPIHRAIPYLDGVGINVRPGFDGRRPVAATTSTDSPSNQTIEGIEPCLCPPSPRSSSKSACKHSPRPTSSQETEPPSNSSRTLESSPSGSPASSLTPTALPESDAAAPQLQGAADVPAAPRARCPYCCRSNDGRSIEVRDGRYALHLTGWGGDCGGSGKTTAELPPLADVPAAAPLPAGFDTHTADLARQALAVVRAEGDNGRSILIRTLKIMREKIRDEGGDYSLKPLIPYAEWAMGESADLPAHVDGGNCTAKVHGPACNGIHYATDVPAAPACEARAALERIADEIPNLDGLDDERLTKGLEWIHQVATGALTGECAHGHYYLSTGCLHHLKGECGRAQHARGVPGHPTCKYCKAKCVCRCHTDPDGECGPHARVHRDYCALEPDHLGWCGPNAGVPAAGEAEVTQP